MMAIAVLIARLTDSAPLPILHHVCAWHTPKAEIDALNQQFPGQISHSICPDCAAKLLFQDVA